MTRVLLVEDNPGDARLLRELLADAGELGFELTTVATLGDGLAIVAEHDVVLLDLTLPDATGLDTVTRMIATARTVPIVVLTGLDDERVPLDAMAAGAQDFLRKADLTPSLLAKTIRYAVERKKAEEHVQQRARSAELARRARFVAEVAAAATSTLELDAGMQAVADLLVPTLGGFCAIDLMVGAERARRVAYAASAPSATTLLRQLCAEPAFGVAAGDVLHAAFETRRAVVVDLSTEALRDGDAYRVLTSALGAQTVLVTPLVVGDRVVGAITYLSGPASPGTAPDDVLLADEIAARVALGIEHARLFADAQRAVQGRDELLAVVSHDLRNPLGVLQLTLGMLERDPASGGVALPRARRAVERMQRLLDDLLDVARIDARTLTADPQPVDLHAMLDDLYEQHRVLAVDKGIRLVRDFTPRLGTVVLDRHRIAQAVSNLLGNALKFTPRDGTIFIAAAPNDGHVAISITDTGPGIARDDLARIFDRFWQSSTRSRDGVGLGLAIVKGIVDAHGGTIDVESEPGHGATFRMRLPVTSRGRAPA